MTPSGAVSLNRSGSSAPFRVVQKLLGHTDIATTARYLHLLPDAERSAVERLEALYTLNT